MIDKFFKKILVFSHFVDVVQSYSEALSTEGIKNMIIIGDTANSERDLILEKFENDENAHVLLCSDGLAQGKNIQCCSVVVNIDQPWNPAICRQRIGRTHRLGQKASVIYVISFLCKDTIEERIYNKIIEKNLIFDAVVGGNERFLHELLEEYPLNNEIKIKKIQEECI